VARRVHATATFYDVRDQSGDVQLVLKQEFCPKYKSMMDLDIGDIVSVRGHVYITPRGQCSLQVEDFELLAKSLRPLPDRKAGLRDKGTRLRHRELDLLGDPHARALFGARARIIAAVRQWLNDRGYTEVETPALQALAGGSNSKPFVTYHYALERELHLAVSPELYLNRTIVGGLENVYALGKSFRNEGISRKHNPEFTELEWMHTYADYQDVAYDTELMVEFVAQTALGSTAIKCQGQDIDFADPWERITMRELIHQRTGLDFLGASVEEMSALVPDSEGLVTKAQCAMELYTKLIEATIIQPTFVFDFPLESFPITKRHPVNPYLGEHFDAVIGGIELVSGDTELNDPADQHQRFVEQQDGQAPQPHDEEYVRALEYGYAPTGGGGMGIDRLVMILTESDSLRDVIPFPMLRLANTS